MLGMRLAAVLALVAATRAASDTSEKGESCAKFDRCKAGDLFRTCSCDSDCHKFGTCCKDADGFALMAPSGGGGQYLCQADRTPTPVFALRTCRESFLAHSDHAHLCTQAEPDPADVLGNVLVTSARTRTTYWNSDCAACNDEDPRDVLHWTVQVTCPAYHGPASFNQRFIETNLMFDPDVGEWGLNVSDGFVVCRLSFHQPSSMVGKLRYCAPNMVSSCPPDFPEKDTVKRCKKYHAERKLKGSDLYFRNSHCAVCNGVGEDEITCVGRNYGLQQVDRYPPGEKVRVVFDSGEWLERDVIVCSRNNSWDPFTKRCRKIPDEIVRIMSEAAAPDAEGGHAPRTVREARFVVVLLLVSLFVVNKRDVV